MITPLGQRRGHKWLWVRYAALYTLGGSISSFSIGAVFGVLGEVARAHLSTRVTWMAFAAWSVILALRDLRVISFSLPQRKAQAPQEWFLRFDYSSVVFMWGFHIGIGLVTFINFGGLYAIAVAAMAGGAKFGGSAMLCYWLGRTLSVWIAPWVMPQPGINLDPCNLFPDLILRGIASIGLLVAAAAGMRVALLL